MTEQQEPGVGQRIRAIREAQSLSLRALAERSGLSLNAISLIERGENSPTVSSLQLLATAFGVPITTFFEDEQKQSVVFVPPQARLRAQTNGITMESLGIGLPQQQLEPFLVKLAPGSGNREQPIRHDGEEFVHCLEGEVSYRVGSETYQLQPGYSLLFEASQPHAFHNSGMGEALLLMVFHAGADRQQARRLHLESSAAEAGQES